MPTSAERYYQEQRRRAAAKRRDQSARQASIDARYAERRDAQLEADVARMLAGETENEDEGLEREA